MTHVDAGRTYASAGASAQQRAASPAAAQAAWFLGLSGLAFLIPYVFTTLIDTNHDLYYLLYFVVSLSALALYVHATGVDLRELFARSWKLSLLLGVAATAFVVWNVLANNDATPRPGGAYFAFELIWRGAAYGIVDALLLSAFPAMVDIHSDAW